MLFKRKPSRDEMVGIWKQTSLAYGGDVIINGRKSSFQAYTTNVITLNRNGTFTIAEEGVRHSSFVEKGTWNLSADRGWLIFTHNTGEIIRMDIRDFKGNSFTTSSIMGNDLVFKRS